jgi:hypothetical protein
MMMDWIDEEKERRQRGIRRPLLQSEHEAVNARYPGCTLEYCSECGNPTGRAGRYDDSIFLDASDGSGEYGPLCTDCADLLRERGLVEK